MESRRKSTESAVKACRSAFLTTTTFRNDRWKLHQLYGLYQLLLDAREELISALAKDYALPTAGYERELALLLQDIASHYLNISNASSASSSVQQSLSGPASLQSLPVGVSLVVSHSANPLRYALAPLAASIAAGNTVILATESECSLFFRLLSEKIGQYLDTQSVHVILDLNLEDSIFSEVDHIFILDERPDRYSAILSSQKNAASHSTVSGVNLAVVDNGSKKTRELTEEIHRSYMLPPSPLAPERLTAVFIRHEDFRAFAESFSTVFENNDHSSKSDPSNELTGLGLRPFAGETTYQAELSHLIQSKYGISRAIEAASRAGVLLVLLYTSLDQVIDSISNAEILQLSLLAPESEANVGYFERWTRSKVFSVGSIRSVISPVIEPRCDISSQSSSRQTLFPQTIFGRSRLTLRGQQPEVPSISSVQRRYNGVVKPPAPEPNQTMEFFGYMTRVLTGVGAVLGGLTIGYLWIGFRRRIAS